MRRHADAIFALHGSYRWRGVWVWLRAYGFWRFVRHPSDVAAEAARLNEGAFS